jgi:DNA-binding CsgD family transcriptional regulator
MCFDALLLVDDARRYKRVNAPATDLLGATATQIIGARIDDFTPGDRRRLLKRLWADLARRGTLDGTYEVLRGDGTRSLVEFRACRDFVPGEHLIVARLIVDELKVREVDLTSRRPGAGVPRVVRLTAREQEVLQLAADGNSTKAIAEMLVVSPGTVKTHFEHIYEKLGVRDRAAAVAEGLRHGPIR